MTHALHYASSVFEGIRSYNGKLFKAKEHYNRLHTSAELLNFKIPYSTETLISATENLLRKGDYENGYVRAISWCGSRVMTVSHNNSNIHTAIGIWERPIKEPTILYEKGISMNISKWKRPDPITCPVHSKASGMYMISSISKKTAEELGYNDSLLLDYQDHIAEATSSNIFLVNNNVIYTPITKCFLNGITRQTVINIAKKLNINILEKNMTIDFLNKITEVFLTGTTVEILPVHSIEDTNRKWTFKPSKITKLITSEYNKITQKNR